MNKGIFILMKQEFRLAKELILYHKKGNLEDFILQIAFLKIAWEFIIRF
jgi:hypothetical protein